MREARGGEKKNNTRKEMHLPERASWPASYVIAQWSADAQVREREKEMERLNHLSKVTFRTFRNQGTLSGLSRA